MEVLTVKKFKNGSGFFSDREVLNDIKLKDDDILINFAYTDYGGDFFDRIAIDFFIDRKEENFIFENTYYYGKNGILWGKTAVDFKEATEKYFLGYEDIEDFYYQKQYESEEKSFQFFVDDEFSDHEHKERILSYLMQEKSGYYSILSSGDVDFSSDKLITFVEDYLENILPLELSKEREEKTNVQYYDVIK
jgi:hypothetical protein